jgi:hypothetical protein
MEAGTVVAGMEAVGMVAGTAGGGMEEVTGLTAMATGVLVTLIGVMAAVGDRVGAADTGAVVITEAGTAVAGVNRSRFLRAARFAAARIV